MRNTLALFLVAIQVLIVSAASAQVANLYDGTWRGSQPGSQDDVVISLNGDSGTIKVFVKGGPAHNDVCLTRTRPVVVQSSSSETLNLLVKGSEAVPGCPDVQIGFRVVDSKTLEGTGPRKIRFFRD